MGWSNQNFVSLMHSPMSNDVFLLHIFYYLNNPLMEWKPKISDTLEIGFYIQTNCCDFAYTKWQIMCISTDQMIESLYFLWGKGYKI